MASLLTLLTTLVYHAQSRDYIYVHQFLNWFEAMDHCMHHFDSTLATIINDDDIYTATETISAGLMGLSPAAWIGLEDIDNNNNWVWADGTQCKLSNSALCTDYWSQTLMSGHCVYHSIQQLEYGFHAHSCQDRQPFICNNNTIANTNNDIGCNYLQISGHGFPTNKCLPYNYADKHTSYKYECSDLQNNNGITVKYWDTAQCDHEPALILNVSNITDYQCNYNDDVSCLNTMDIKWYLSPTYDDKCVQNERYNYIETRIIGECLQMDGAHYLMWQCFDDHYVGAVYDDHSCNHLVDSKIFEFGECIDGLKQYHSCQGPVITPVPPTTTTDSEQICDYVNFDGIARRINICHPAKYHGMDFFYRLECDAATNTDNGMSAVVRRWYDMNGCVGNGIHTQYYAPADIVDFQCGSNICNERDVLIVKNYDVPHCKVDENNYTISDVLINKCFKDKNNGSKLIECHSIDNDFGYAVKYFADATCHNTQDMNIEIYSEAECIGNELEHIIWCNGPNTDYIHDTKCEYIMDADRNLIHPINTCTMFKMAGGYFSNKYVCNYETTQMDEVWYKGTQCDTQQIITTYKHDRNQTNFNCNRNMNVSLEMNVADRCDADGNKLLVRWYKKDPLTSDGDCMRKKGFIDDNVLIVDECIPDIVNSEGIIYMKMECDDEGLEWFQINYYEDFNCNHYSKIDSLRFRNGECYGGDILDIVSCKSNKQQSHSSYASSSSLSSSSSSSDR